MNKIKIFVIFCFCLIFAGCGGIVNVDVNQNGLGVKNAYVSNGFESYNEYERKAMKDYEGEIDCFSDNKGIHITLKNLEYNKFTSIQVIRNISGSNNPVLMGSVSPVIDKYFYLVEEEPCGEKIFSIKEGTLTEVESSWHTNYLNGNISFDFNFVEPDEKYKLIVLLKYSQGEKYDAVSKFTGIYNEEKDSVFYKTIEIKTPSVIETAVVPSATYSREQDLYAFSKIDLSKTDYYSNVENESQISFNCTAVYGTDSPDDIIAVPYIPVNNFFKGIKIEELMYEMDNPPFETDLYIKKISGSLFYSEYVEKPSILNSEILNYQNLSYEEKKILLTYYKKYYSLKNYEYNDLTFSKEGVPKTINVIDPRMPLDFQVQDTGNVLSFTFTDYSKKIEIYRNNEIAGVMEGEFTTGKTYSFTDFYPEPNKENTYYVRWDNKKSKKTSVIAKQSYIYTPNQIILTYNAENKTLSVTQNPFANKLPEGYKGEFSFAYKVHSDNPYLSNYFESNEVKQQDFIVTNSDKEVKDFAEYIVSLENRYVQKGIFIKPESPYKICSSGDTESISYLCYGKFNDVSKIPVIKITESYQAEDPKDNPEEKPGEQPEEKPGEQPEEKPELPEYEEVFAVDESLLKIQRYNFMNDNISIKSIKQTSEGVELEVYLPEFVDGIKIKRKNTSTGQIDAEYIFNYNIFHYPDYFVEDFNNCDWDWKPLTVKVTDYSIQKGVTYEYIMTEFMMGYGSHYWFPDYYYTREDEDEHIGVLFTAENDSAYYISGITSLKPEEMNLASGFTSSMYGTWNKIPNGYKLWTDYQNDVDSGRAVFVPKFYRVVEKISSQKYETVLDGAYKIPESYDVSVNLECTKIIKASEEFKDIYGNYLDVITTYPEKCKINIRNYFKSELDNYDYGYGYGYEEDKIIHLIYNNRYSNTSINNKTIPNSEYTLKSASSMIYNDQGMWKYYDMRISPEPVIITVYEVQN